MTQQIKMQIIDRNAHLKKITTNTQNNPSSILKFFKANILNSPMISVVQNSKSGCSSCGH